MKFLKLTLIILALGFSSCSYQNEDLIGKWKYLNYEYTNKSLEKPLANIAIQKPYIIFEESGKCEIYSSGKVLSNGVYQLDGKIIRYEEVLPDGTKRAIPFLIKELDDKTLVFETMDGEVKRITAEKVD